MIKKEWESTGPKETQALAKALLETCPNHRIFAFYGDLGAGKTTLTQAFCEVLGVLDTVKSPTFSIINEYDSPSEKVYHFDFYRIEKLEEVLDIGLEEYLDSGAYCLMEWPERIDPLLPNDTVEVRIHHQGGDQRKIELLAPDL